MPTVVIGDNTGDDYSGTEDAYLRSNTATTNYGAATALGVSDRSDAGSYDAVLPIAFSGLSNIPAGSTISIGTINLYLTSSSSPDYGIELRRLLRNWVENQATWNIWSTGNDWTTAGAQSDGNDRSATVTATLSVPAVNGQYNTWSDAQLTQDFQDIHDSVNPNYGWLFQPSSFSADNYRFFASSEGTDGQRPYATATYTTGGATVTLSGISATSAAGTLSSNGDTIISLGGISSSGQAGSLLIAGNAIVSLAGTSAIGEIGIIVSESGAIVTLSGISAIGTVGTIAAISGALAALSGIQANASSGSLEAKIGSIVNLAGISATAQIGILDVTGGARVALDSISATGQTGTITADITLADISIPDYRTYMIEHENRTYLILVEDRNYGVGSDDKTYKVH